MVLAPESRSSAIDGEQLRLLEKMARGATLGELLDSIVALVEARSSGELLCSILLYDAAERRLRHGSAPSLPAEYCAAIDGMEIGAAVGSCGTAAFLRQPVIVEDIATHPFWQDYKHLALPHGLRACWSHPILRADGEVLGTFATYLREPRSPTDAELRWVDAVSHFAAVSIDRHRTMQLHEQAEQRATKLARLYAVSSSVGDAIVHVRDAQALYEQACRIAVEHGLARLAWVGIYDEHTDRIVPVARCGEDRGYIDAIVLNFRAGENIRGPAARALRTGACAFSNDVAVDPDFYWRDEAVARGLRACGVFPLRANGRTSGILAMYADEPGYFGAEEQKVLGALADNVAFAVASADAERERQRLLWNLTERNKELTLLHGVARLLQTRALEDGLLAEIARAIPRGMQFPQSCAARIEFKQHEAGTPNWRDSDRVLRAPIDAGGHSGAIEVAYVDAAGQATFLREEQDVVRSLGDMLSTYFERRLASAARQQSEERLKAVIEHTPNVAIQWYDRSGRLLFCNQASQTLFGWRADRAVGKTLAELNFSAKEAKRFQGAIARVAATGLPFGPVEFNYTRTDGSLGTLLSTVFRIPRGDGEDCFVCMDVDLTERKRMIENVRAAEKLRAALFNSVADGIFYVAVEPDRQLRFVAVNPAFLAATGLREADVVGRPVAEVVPETARQAALAMFARAVEHNETVSWEEAAGYPAGLRHREITVAPILGSDGRCTHLVGTVHDITQRKQAEEHKRELQAELATAKRLEALGALAGGVAHDFNNILAAIAGHATLALESETGDASGSLAEIREAANRGTALVRQLLTFGRAERLERTAVDVSRVIDEAVRLLKATAPAGVTLRASHSSTTPRAHADAAQVHQIILNLVTNAMQAFEGKEGVVEIETDGVDASALSAAVTPGRYVRVRVRDTGCGMSQATAQRIFEPFFTTKAASTGTGLGLSVVHGIVKSHGGTISVRSELGRGTELEVLLPAVPQARPAEAAPAANGAEVLYVDDDESLGYLIDRALSRFGYRVTTRTNALEALRDFKTDPARFSAVVTDVSMGGLSGLDLARELRAVRADLPIVVTSGYVRDEVVDACRDLGAEVIPKPNAASDLGLMLRELLTRAS